jgi:predicted Rdx family selenoprotein
LNPFLTNPNPQLAQELLSTFSTALGEVALQPSTGGVFRVEITVPILAPDPAGQQQQQQQQQPAKDSGVSAGFHSRAVLDAAPAAAVQRTHLLWDRKAEGGFPETKELKRRVRDVVDPTRDLGHVDRDHHQPQSAMGEAGEGQKPLLPHGIGAHTKKPPAEATAEVRERLERKNQGSTAPSVGASGAAASAEESKADNAEKCEDCA